MATELQQACEAGNIEEVKKLIAKKKVNLNATDKRGWTALHCAANKASEKENYGNPAFLTICQMLLKAGADPTIASNPPSQNTPLAYLVKLVPSDDRIRAELVRTLEMILERGASIAHRNTLGITALHEAAFKGAVDSVTFLISRGADINCRTNDNETALHYAVRARDPVMVKLLLHRGANTDYAGATSGTAFALAQQMKAKDVIRMLDNFKVRKEFFFSIPPPAYVSTFPPPLPANFPFPSPALAAAHLPPAP